MPLHAVWQGQRAAETAASTDAGGVGPQSAVAFGQLDPLGSGVRLCVVVGPGPGPAVSPLATRVDPRKLMNAMAVSATSDEEAQLSQTIEMFEVITRSQPHDYQSLEILKDAYSKLGRQKEAVQTSRRIAEAYLQLGQLSSAILEYESILQRFPNDPDVQQALLEIESKASNLAPPKSGFELEEKPAQRPLPSVPHQPKKLGAEQIDDGRQTMQKLFVEGKLLSLADFNASWPAVNPYEALKRPLEPFIHVLAERGLVPAETSLKLLLEKSRLCYLPVERYELDMDLARSFPREICQRWCILPFDRMSKSILIATANPFNKQAGLDLEGFTRSRVLWYMTSPGELLSLLRKVFR